MHQVRQTRLRLTTRRGRFTAAGMVARAFRRREGSIPLRRTSSFTVTWEPAMVRSFRTPEHTIVRLFAALQEL